MARYVHSPIGTETGTPPLSYILDAEECISHNGSALLCLRVHTVTGSACCGAGELFYLVVPGRVISWKHALEGSGDPVSEVAHITEPSDQAVVKKFLAERFPSLQVVFETPQKQGNRYEGGVT
jgi:hypothetical protein